MSWEDQLAYTLRGISSQFPSNFRLFVISPKQGCRGIKSDKKCPKNTLVCFNYHHTISFQIQDHLDKVETLYSHV